MAKHGRNRGRPPGSTNLALPPATIQESWGIMERRSMIRGLLSFGTRLRSIAEIMRALGDGFYPNTTSEINFRKRLAEDMNAIGARRDKDADGFYWTVGAAWEAPLAYAADDELHLSELQRVLKSDVLEARQVGPMITFRAAPMSGSKLKWWLSMLEWREIIMTVGDDFGVLMFCTSTEQAKWVITRLYGQPPQGKPLTDTDDREEIIMKAGEEFGGYMTLQDRLKALQDETDEDWMYRPLVEEEE